MIMGYLQRAFTLVEMLIVLGIIGILLIILLPVYDKYRTKANFAEAATLSQGIVTAIRSCTQLNVGIATCNKDDDEDVKRAWDIAKASSKIDGASPKTKFTNFANIPGGRQGMTWDLDVIIPGRQDVNGNPLKSLFQAEVWRNRRDGSLDVIVPTFGSPCVQDGWC